MADQSFLLGRHRRVINKPQVRYDVSDDTGLAVDKGMSRAVPSGFTLIELLVVIAIIAILAALLLPALSKAKDSGLGASCQSNTHELGMGVLMYADDNRQFFPRSRSAQFPGLVVGRAVPQSSGPALWWRMVCGRRPDSVAASAQYPGPHGGALPQKSAGLGLPQTEAGHVVHYCGWKL